MQRCVIPEALMIVTRCFCMGSDIRSVLANVPDRLYPKLGNSRGTYARCLPTVDGPVQSFAR
jgi:hypothetical protein